MRGEFEKRVSKRCAAAFEIVVYILFSAVVTTACIVLARSGIYLGRCL